MTTRRIQMRGDDYVPPGSGLGPLAYDPRHGAVRPLRDGRLTLALPMAALSRVVLCVSDPAGGAVRALGPGGAEVARGTPGNDAVVTLVCPASAIAADGATLSVTLRPDPQTAAGPPLLFHALDAVQD